MQPQLNYPVLLTALRKKDIKVNGVRVKERVTLSGGETIEIFMPEPAIKQVPVVFEDDNLLIAEKPQGMEVTIKDKVFDKSLCLEEVFSPYRAVHRLDKNTEGMVILAKTQNAYRLLTQAFRDGYVEKHYIAWIAGKPKPRAQLCDYWVKKDKSVVISSQPLAGGVVVKTNYTTLKSTAETAWLDVELLTGKTHQIRAHLAHYGIFVIGDEKYGDKAINKKFKKHVQCLCASAICFHFPQNHALYYLNAKTFSVQPSFKME